MSDDLFKDDFAPVRVMDPVRPGEKDRSTPMDKLNDCQHALHYAYLILANIFGPGHEFAVETQEVRGKVNAEIARRKG